MHFSSIELYNFGIYNGLHTMNLLDQQGKRNVTLVGGMNGRGKTTFLELITGDNMQVFANDVRIFGHRRGTGETIWELKEK